MNDAEKHEDGETAVLSVLPAAARTGAALLALVVIVMFMAGAFRSKIRPGVLPAAASMLAGDTETAVVVAEVVTVHEEATGTVQAEHRTTVSSRILATIDAILVRAGDAVRRGDPLVQLDAVELHARVEEAQRGLDAANANLRRRAADFERAQRLVRDGVMSRSEFDQAEAAARVAEAERDQAIEVLTRARINVGYATITSPVSGKVVDRLADPGDTASPGMPLLSLYDPSALRIEVPVRESLVARLRLGAEIEVRIGDRAASVTAIVDEIVPQAEPGSRTFLVKLRLPPREDVYAGMFGRILIPAGERERLLVPRAAIERVGQLEFATVVDAAGAAVRRLVRVGRGTASGAYEVLSGLAAGERVVVHPTFAEGTNRTPEL